MTLVGAFGLVLGLLACLKAFVFPSRLRIVVFVLAYLTHLGTTMLYYNLVKNGGGDAAIYYYDLYGSFDQGFGLSTQFVIYITQLAKSAVGGTYFDYFLVYQSLGFIGVAFLMRALEETYLSVGIEQPAYSYLIIFLPSVHYWTSAIGKDGLFFLATTLSVWAMMAMRQRMIPLAIAITVLFLIRPHIAMIALAALALTVVADRKLHPLARVVLVGIAIGGVAYAIASMRSLFQIDLARTDVVSDLLAGREALLQTEDAGRTAVTGSYPIRVFSFLFRPFFVDAGGALGLIVSVENLLLMIMIGMMLYHFRTMRRLFKSVPYVRFALISATLIVLLLAISYYNVGLGIRQKAVMVLPSLLIVFVTLRAVLGARTRAARFVQTGPEPQAIASS